MSDTSTNPGEKPVNDGGGNAPQSEPQPTDDAAAETQVSQGGGSD